MAESTLKASVSSRKPAQSRIVLRLAASLIPVGVTLLLVILDSNLTDPFRSAGAWLACLGLVTLSSVIVKPPQWELQSEYRLLGITTAWLALSFGAALSVLISGTLLAAAIRAILNKTRPAFSPGEDFRQLLQLCATSAAALIFSAALYAAFAGTIPLRQIDTSTLPVLLVALAVSFLSSYLLSHRTSLIPLSVKLPTTQEFYEALVNKLLLLPTVLVLPLILYQVGLAAFVVIMFVIAIQAVRYHQADEQARENAELYDQSLELVRKLSLINEAAHQVMLDFSQQNALRQACETALAIAHVNKVAIFMVDSDRENVNLVEHVGLTSEYQALTRVMPFRPNSLSASLNVIPDVSQIQNDPELIHLAQAGQFRACVQMPLHSGELVTGYLVVYSDQPHVYSETELYLLRILCNQISAALDNTQLLRALELYAFETTHLMYLSSSPTSNLELEKIAADVSGVLRLMMAVDWVLITLIDNEHEQAQILGSAHNGHNLPAQDTTSLPIKLFPEIRQLQSEASSRARIFQYGDIHLSAPLSQFMEQNQAVSLVTVPMIMNQSVFGFILLGTHETYVPAKNEQQLLETATNQIAIQLHNAQLYTTTHKALNRRLQQLALIESIVQQISSSRNFNEIITDVLEAAVITTQADMVALALLTEADDVWVIMQKYKDGKAHKYYLPQRKDEGVIGRVIQTGEIVQIPDNREISYYKPSPPEVYLSSLAVPLIKDKATIGVLDVESSQLNFFTHEEALFLKNLGAHAIVSIENVRLLEELQYQIDILTSLRELSLQLSTAVETDAVAQAVLETALATTHAQYALLFRYEEATDRLIPLASREADMIFTGEDEVDFVRQLARRAATTGEMQTVEPVSTLVHDGMNAQAVKRPSVVAIPIKRGSEVREILCVAFIEEQLFQSRELNTLSLLSIQAAGHLENASLHEQIRNSRDRMRAILDSTRDGVILLDEDGLLVEVNPWAEKLLGLNLSEHIGEHFVDLLIQYADPEEEGYTGYSREELKNLARLQRLEPDNITRRQFERRTPQNQSIYIEEIGSPVIGEDSHVAGRLLVLRDITEERELEIFRDEISGMVIHDLRGPLSGVINGINLTRGYIPEMARYPSAETTLKIAMDNAEKLLGMVDSLMEIAKLESKEIKLDLGPEPIEPLIESAYQTLSSSMAQSGLELELRIPPGLPQVNVDGEKIRRVLVNLLDNALRYAPANGKILVAVLSEPKKGRLLIKVADNGPGIPPTEREHIFEKYRQVKINTPQRGSKGSGLGLTFCKLVIEAHGQRIWVDAEGPLSGACFAFTLPTVS